MKKLKLNKFSFILGTILTCAGILLFLLDIQFINRILIYLFGTLVLVDGVFDIVKYRKSKDKNYIYSGIINVILGIILIFMHHALINVLVMIVFIIFPIVRIVKSKTPALQLEKEIPAFLIALIILTFSLSGIVEILVKLFAGCLVVFGIIALIASFYTEKVVE